MQLWWNVYDKNRLCKYTNQFHKQPCDLPTFKSFFSFFFFSWWQTHSSKKGKQYWFLSFVCYFSFLQHISRPKIVVAENVRGTKDVKTNCFPCQKLCRKNLSQPLNWVFPRLAPVLWSFFLSAADLPCNSSCSFCWREPWRQRGAMKLVTRNVKI